MGKDSDLISVSTTQQGITTITITRPHRRNAVNHAAAEALFKAFLAFEADATQKVAVFTGNDGYFCAGADLIDITTTRQNREAISLNGENDQRMEYVQGRNIAPMGPSRLQVSKPVIAAVAGHAVAGGLELSLLADIRVVEEDAVFGVYCRRWGVPLIDGGTVRLQKVLGLGRAMDMILTGRPVDAKEAYAMGLANRVVRKGEALGEAMKIAEQLLRFPQACMNADRASAYYAAYEASSFEDAMRNEYEQGSKVLETESFKGAARFAGGLGRHGGFSKL
jgi:enoyl-CoA hydratase/carnithine racemase